MGLHYVQLLILENLDMKIMGFTSIEWLHHSFVVIRYCNAYIKPEHIWGIGYSDPQEKYQLLYCDLRGVARIFNLTFEDNKIDCWRADKDFYPRVTLPIITDGLHSMAEASEDKGKTWRKDLEMAYTKVESS
jgi:hypothetical protein